MRERAAAAGALVLVAVCCAGPAVVTGAVGGVTLAAAMRATGLGLLGLGPIAVLGVLAARRRRCRALARDTAHPTHITETMPHDHRDHHR